MLDVFITVDVEIWPTSCAREKGGVRNALSRYIYGKTRAGNFGLAYQLEVLNAHNLKAIFFVEALFADAVGIGYLQEIVDLIVEAGQEVQLHLHTEWLQEIEDPNLLIPKRRDIQDFVENDQSLLIRRGLENLGQCGVERVCGFRAGNYGANLDTLRALAANGIAYDSSYNPCYLNHDCGIHLDRVLLQPAPVEGVVEIPISCFEDRPGHLRHAQISACSYWELETILSNAHDRGWHSFVIVSHGFELLNRLKDRPDTIAVKRFERLCAFLAENRERFQTVGFEDIPPISASASDLVDVLKSSSIRTLFRYFEQAARRVYR